MYNTLVIQPLSLQLTGQLFLKSCRVGQVLVCALRLIRYITLGSPHAPPPPGVEGVVDQTRGILNWCQDAAPGAYHPEVRQTGGRPFYVGSNCFSFAEM
jgi:hypothetical protein